MILTALMPVFSGYQQAHAQDLLMKAGVLYDGNMGCLKPRRTFTFCPFHDL